MSTTKDRRNRGLVAHAMRRLLIALWAVPVFTLAIMLYLSVIPIWALASAAKWAWHMAQDLGEID